MKVCCVCKQNKSLAKFHKKKSAKDGRQARCAECATQANIERYGQKKKQLIEYQRQYDARTIFERRVKDIVKTYNVTKQQAEKLASTTECAICGGNRSTRAMAVDHCHDTGRVRGVLCNKCNLALGGFDDSIEMLQKAIKYLKRR
jgi:Recombination endonuclease VII